MQPGSLGRCPVTGQGSLHGAGVRGLGSLPLGRVPTPVWVPHEPKRIGMSGGSWPSTQTGSPPVLGRLTPVYLDLGR